MSRNSSRASRKPVRSDVSNVVDIRKTRYEEGTQKDEPIKLVAKTENQQQLLSNIWDHGVSAGLGPAGVGKTFITSGVAGQMFQQGRVEKIVLTRANVTIGNTIGMLPGEINDKMRPLLAPILSDLERHLTPKKVEYMLRHEQLEMLPFEYVRGRNFRKTFTIVDESQNLTEEDMVAICTRYESGRIVLIGDPVQNDLETQDGLSWLDHFSRQFGLDFALVKFSLDDIVRSGFVKRFLEAYYASKGRDKYGDRIKPATKPK